MRENMSWLGRLALVVVAPVGLAACLQGEGERCQVQSDCGSVNGTQLICVLPPGGSPQTGGVCQLPGEFSGDMSVVDMAMPVTRDMRMPDDMRETD
jgi:hypothetical protein